MSHALNPVLGRCLGGDFDIVRPIASGGVASVYEAVQRSTGKARAVKVMHSWLIRDDRMRGRFIDEARIAGSIESDHVVEVVSAGIDPELDAPWIAMELLRGRTLADHVEQLGPMSPHQLLEAMLQAQHGLQRSHERNLVHRDLKPDNVFVAEPKRPGVPFTIKVLDFGIAKWVHDARDDLQNSQIIGTPSWMAPEQLSHVTAITPATDVWAMGLLAFWSLTGWEYWLAANVDPVSVSAVLLEIVTGPRVPASSRAADLGASVVLPDGFDAWFATAVALDPAQRYPDAASCVDALMPVLERAPRRTTSRSIAGGLARAVVPAPTELDVALDRIVAPASPHAATAALAPVPTTTPPRASARPMARRVTAESLRDEVLVDGARVRPILPLATLLAEALGPSSAREDASGSRTMPDRVGEAVRHACFVLGVHPAAEVVASESAEPCFVVTRLSPATLKGSSVLLGEPDEARLRAHAAVGVGRTLAPLAALGAFDSLDAFLAARRATQTFLRGGVSASPGFRRIVGVLGSRRGELAAASEAASTVESDVYWDAAVRTLARLALLVAADDEAVVHAMDAAGLTLPDDGLRAELRTFRASAEFASYWHGAVP